MAFVALLVTQELHLEGNLKAKYVIHTVGPRYLIDENPGQLLTSAFKRSLDLAISNQCGSIAFPAISCGAYGYPPTEAANIAISVCKREIYNDLMIIIFTYSTKS